MSCIKRWLWELIESGEYQYLARIGAPLWAISEAKRHAEDPEQSADEAEG